MLDPITVRHRVAENIEDIIFTCGSFKEHGNFISCAFLFKPQEYRDNVAFYIYYKKDNIQERIYNTLVKILKQKDLITAITNLQSDYHCLKLISSYVVRYGYEYIKEGEPDTVSV